MSDNYEYKRSDIPDSGRPMQPPVGNRPNSLSDNQKWRNNELRKLGSGKPRNYESPEQVDCQVEPPRSTISYSLAEIHRRLQQIHSIKAPPRNVVNTIRNLGIASDHHHAVGKQCGLYDNMSIYRQPSNTGMINRRGPNKYWESATLGSQTRDTELQYPTSRSDRRLGNRQHLVTRYQGFDVKRNRARNRAGPSCFPHRPILDDVCEKEVQPSCQLVTKESTESVKDGSDPRSDCNFRMFMRKLQGLSTYEVPDGYETNEEFHHEKYDRDSTNLHVHSERGDHPACHEIIPTTAIQSTDKKYDDVLQESDVFTYVDLPPRIVLDDQGNVTDLTYVDLPPRIFLDDQGNVTDLTYVDLPPRIAIDEEENENDLTYVDLPPRIVLEDDENVTDLTYVDLPPRIVLDEDENDNDLTYVDLPPRIVLDEEENENDLTCVDLPPRIVLNEDENENDLTYVDLPPRIFLDEEENENDLTYVDLPPRIVLDEDENENDLTYVDLPPRIVLDEKENENDLTYVDLPPLIVKHDCEEVNLTNISYLQGHQDISEHEDHSDTAENDDSFTSSGDSAVITVVENELVTRKNDGHDYPAMLSDTLELIDDCSEFEYHDIYDDKNNDDATRIEKLGCKSPVFESQGKCDDEERKSAISDKIPGSDENLDNLMKHISPPEYVEPKPLRKPNIPIGDNLMYRHIFNGIVFIIKTLYY